MSLTFSPVPDYTCPRHLIFQPRQVFGVMRTIAIVVSVMVVWASAAFADPEGFVIEAVMASPAADSPLQRETAVNVAEGGYIVILARSGQLLRRDGPYQGPASDLLDAILAPDKCTQSHNQTACVSMAAQV